MRDRRDQGMVSIDNGIPVVFAKAADSAIVAGIQAGQRPDLDPRWDWIEVTRFGDPGPVWVRGPCRHTEIIPVESVTGEVVAQLCRTCDTQFPGPAGRRIGTVHGE